MQAVRFHFSSPETAQNTLSHERLSRARVVKFQAIRVIHPNHETGRMEIRERLTNSHVMRNHFAKTLNLD